MTSGAVLIGDELAAQKVASLGELHLIGAWPLGTSGGDKAAHIYQANQVQEAVWRGIIAPFLQHGPAAGGGGSGGISLGKGIAIAGVTAAAVIGAWQLYEAWRGA